MELVDAIDQAKNLVNMAIQYSDGQGRGTSPVNVLAFARRKSSGVNTVPAPAVLLPPGCPVLT